MEYSQTNSMCHGIKIYKIIKIKDKSLYLLSDGRETGFGGFVHVVSLLQSDFSNELMTDRLITSCRKIQKDQESTRHDLA